MRTQLYIIMFQCVFIPIEHNCGVNRYHSHLTNCMIWRGVQLCGIKGPALKGNVIGPPYHISATGDRVETGPSQDLPLVYTVEVWSEIQMV